MFCDRIKRTITQSFACRRRALLPASGLNFGKHAAQRFVFLMKVQVRSFKFSSARRPRSLSKRDKVAPRPVMRTGSELNA